MSDCQVDVLRLANKQLLCAVHHHSVLKHGIASDRFMIICVCEKTVGRGYVSGIQYYNKQKKKKKLCLCGWAGVEPTEFARYKKNNSKIEMGAQRQTQTQPLHHPECLL
jgi:hypothetical protein